MHDFSVVSGGRVPVPHPHPRLESIDVARHDAVLTIDVRANAFLHHMVRNIAGVLISVGGASSPAAG